SHLEDWYETFGLKRVGEPFYEAGLEHITMAREPMLPQDGTLGVDTELGAVNEDTPSDVDHGTPEPGTPQYFEDLQRRYRMRRSRGARVVQDDVVEGSNPVTPTQYCCHTNHWSNSALATRAIKAEVLLFSGERLVANRALRTSC